MKKEKVDAVWSSDRKRALQSARIIFKNKPIKIERNLREISFGVFEGLTHEDIMTKYPKIYSRWAAKPFKVKIPGGEAPAAFKKRVLSAFKNIVRAAKGRTIAIVTHGGVIYAITGEMLKPGEYFEWVR